MKNLTECGKFANFDVHSVRFDFCITAFGYFDIHKLQAGNCLILRQTDTLAKTADIMANIHIWPDFLHHESLFLIVRYIEYRLIICVKIKTMFRNNEMFRYSERKQEKGIG